MRFSAFTLVELLVVTAVIAILLGFLIPALSPNSGRALEGDARNFAAQLENAQLMALAKRTKTRVLIAATNDWGPDASWRAYLLARYDGTSGNWLQQGKLNRLSQTTTFDSTTGNCCGAQHSLYSGRQDAKRHSDSKAGQFHRCLCGILAQRVHQPRSECYAGIDSDSGWLCTHRRLLTHAGSKKPSFAFGTDDRSADRKRRSKMNRLDHTKSE